MFSTKQENGSFRRRYNFELERDFAELNIATIVKYNRLRWAAHLAQMQENRVPRKLFEQDPEGCKGVGRPKTRWIDGVQADLRTLGVKNCKREVQNKAFWNNVMKQAKSKKWTWIQSKVSCGVSTSSSSSLPFSIFDRKDG